MPSLRGLLDDVLANAGNLNGVNGRVPWSQRFAEAWAARTGREAVLGTRLRAFELRAVIAPPPVPGALRKAGPADTERAFAFAQAFWAEVMGNDPGSPTPEGVARKVEAGEIYLWEDEGAPVCLVGRSRPMPHGVTLGPIYTLPDQRGRGYAAACTAAVSRLLLDGGWDYCALFTDLDNPTSNHVYEKIGYRRVCDYGDYQFGSHCPLEPPTPGQRAARGARLPLLEASLRQAAAFGSFAAAVHVPTARGSACGSLLQRVVQTGAPVAPPLRGGAIRLTLNENAQVPHFFI